MRLKLGLLVMALVSAPQERGAAQTLEVGDTVLVHQATGRVAGTLLRFDGQTALILANGDSTHLTLEEGTRIFAGRRSSHAVTGALIGGVAGGVLGWTIGYTSSELPNCVSFPNFFGPPARCPTERVEVKHRGFPAVLGALLGTALGGGLGSRLKSERLRWTPLRQARLEVMPTPQHLKLTVRIRMR